MQEHWALKLEKNLIYEGIKHAPDLYRFGTCKIKREYVKKVLDSDIGNCIVEETQKSKRRLSDSQQTRTKQPKMKRNRRAIGYWGGLGSIFNWQQVITVKATVICALELGTDTWTYPVCCHDSISLKRATGLCDLVPQFVRGTRSFLITPSKKFWTLTCILWWSSSTIAAKMVMLLIQAKSTSNAENKRFLQCAILHEK